MTGVAQEVGFKLIDFKNDKQKEICDYVEIDLEIENKHELEKLIKISL